jgi:uncharacterized protein
MDLVPAPFRELPAGAVQPAGWLRRQLWLQAIGITGHLGEIWPDVGSNSAWLGGTGEDWERGPYYLDGLIALAYVLRDQRLVALAQRWVEAVLASQRSDGFFGPASRPDWWSRMPMLKALQQYVAATNDGRVLELMLAYARYQRARLPAQPLERWADVRSGDELTVLLWLWERTGQPELLDLAQALIDQTFDWTSFFHTLPPRDKQSQWAPQVHVVNVAMALKQPALRWRFSWSPRDATAAGVGLDLLTRYHGLANHLFSGDEWLAGPDPSQGTETCAVVELLFSLEVLTRTLGSVRFADLLERVAYNALPAAFTPDLWGHQYDQQPNQVQVSRAARRWTANGDDANLFGLEPNFGCCTANLHQGWPKFAASLWAATSDGGLAALAYGPCRVEHRLTPGLSVAVDEHTDYPFGDSIELRLWPSRPARFPVRLRLPAWCQAPELRLNGQPLPLPASGQFARIEGPWQPGDTLSLRLPMATHVRRWHRQSASLERGPLVFCLPLGEAWQKLGGAEPCPDWEIRPTTPWNYALGVGPEDEPSVEVETSPVPAQPFDSVAPPVRLIARGRRLPDWRIDHNSAGQVPLSPARANTPDEQLTLVPYGCARLRVTQLPTLAR